MSMKIFTAAIIAAFLFLSPATAQEKAIVLDWASLLPENEKNAAAPPPNQVDHEGGDEMEQTGSSEVVPELDGQYVRLPGFMLPLEYGEGGVVTNFLLVPYFGACIHVPPPPPNQIVYVDTMGDPVKSKGMWDPIWIVGTLRTKANMNGLGDTAYTMELDRVEAYED